MFTAVGEGGIGLLLLMLPAVVCSILLGIDSPSPEALVMSRFAGAALIAIGVACWLVRRDGDSAGQRGILVGVFTYDVAAAAILAYVAIVRNMVGIALWPAVVIHAALATRCAACLRLDDTRDNV
jgi:hypothetical protein